MILLINRTSSIILYGWEVEYTIFIGHGVLHADIDIAKYYSRAIANAFACLVILFQKSLAFFAARIVIIHE